MAIRKGKRFDAEMDETFPQGLVLVGGVRAATEFQSQEDRTRGREPRQLFDEQTAKHMWLGTVTDPDESRAKRASFEIKLVADVQPVPPTDEVMPGMRPIALEGLQVEPRIAGQGEFKYLTYQVWATGFADPTQGSGRTSKTPASASTASKETSAKEAA
ncbi:MAG: hypothetical protein ACRDQA_26385 [Nocardioidaceae bacterium]